MILREFGVDKTGDVLDSADAGEIFDEVYRDAILDPEAVGVRVDSSSEKVRAQAESMRQCTSLLVQTAGGESLVTPNGSSAIRYLTGSNG